MVINKNIVQECSTKWGTELQKIVDNYELRDIEEVFPATPLQSRFLSSLTNDSQAHVVQWVCEIEGAFSESQLRSAWYRVVVANPILRTRLVSTRQGVYQVILKTHPPAFEDSLEWEKDEADKLKECFLIADRKRGFQFNSDTLARFTVVLIKGSNHYKLFWTMHRSIVDGFSSHRLLGELLRAYSGTRLKTQSQYKAKVESILSPNLREAETFWKATFDGSKVLAKMGISNRTDNLKDEGSILQTYELKLAMNRLQLYCNKIDVTLSSFFQAIWAIVLRHYIRCDDVYYEYAIPGLNEGEADLTSFNEIRRLDTIVNSIPVRAILKDNMTFIELLRAIQEFHTASLPHRYVSLTDIERWTDLPWTREMAPTLFSFHSDRSRRYNIEDSIRDFKINNLQLFETTEYSLYLKICPTDSSLFLDTIINTTKIDSIAVNQFITKFEEVVLRIVEGSIEHPPTLLDLDALTSTDQFTLADISHGKQIPLIHQCLHHGFELNAIESPNTLAIEGASGTINYSELDIRANWIAHELRRQGVIPGWNVGLVINRSIEMIIGILAILKAGGAYVPIDATLPRGRVEYILKDADCLVVVTMRDTVNVIPEAASHKITLIDDFMNSALDNITKPADLSTSDDTAYIVYTSGTTGEPKGVPIHHGGAMNCIQDFLTKNGSGPGLFQSQFMSVGFDGAIAEIFSCFIHGGTLVLTSDGNRIESLKNVESLLITPTGLQHVEPKDVPNLRVITLGAEPVPQSLVDKWLPHVNLFNAY
ncbi:uncharacterized protein VTP21DRAFT_4723, partial [Calcarisporiella thermophila]|uniref:uncharacterized protein n=1 Tax=Calcarisporiella thermophila TaxID=911321 RepID=UPI0037440DB4